MWRFFGVGAAWTRISVVYLEEYLGGVGLAFVALIVGWVGFVACFVCHWGVWDFVVCVACNRIVWSEEIWCCWIGFSIGVVGNIGGVQFVNCISLSKGCLACKLNGGSLTD